MADNFPLTPGAGRSAATDQVTYSGDTADVQLVRFVQVMGAEGSKTVVEFPAHDAALTNVVPLPLGGYASAAAPADVSADGDAVWSWHLRNGARAVALTAAGALLGGDATNGLDVDVTRVKPDGTNTMPSLDTAARRGYITITDGTNSMPTMDTVARSGFIRHTDGTYTAGVSPTGFARVSDEPKPLFYDPFESLDTTNRWTSTNAGGGAAAAVSTGRLTLGSGTTVNGYSYLTSQPTFIPTVPGWIGFSFVIKLETPVANNAVRFWGMGIVSGSVPSSTNPLGTTGNGMGFEIDTAGVLRAVMYSNGTRTVISELASNQPADANDHRYIVVYRTDATYFYIDGLGSSQLVATSAFQSPNVQVLSELLLSVAHSAAPASSRVIDCAGLAVWDTAKFNTTLSDPVFPWRRQNVLKASTAAAATDLPAVVALHPTSPVPTGTNVMGRVGIDQTTPGTTNAVVNTGNVAHDGVDSGNPVKIGSRAIAHGANPTAVAAADRTDLLANRAGVPFVIGGHPNVVSYTHTAITTAVTDSALVTVAAGLKIVVTGITVTLDNASTVFPSVRIGFGTANVPALGNAGIVLAHGGVPAGGGINRGDGSGILAIGADDQDLRITTVGNATGGGLQVTVTYYTIES